MTTEREQGAGAPRRRDAYSDERDERLFWAVVRPSQEPTRRRWFLPAALVIVVFSAPWYLPEAAAERMFGGLPLWVWIAIAGAAGLAALTSYTVLRHWRDDGP